VLWSRNQNSRNRNFLPYWNRNRNALRFRTRNRIWILIKNKNGTQMSKNQNWVANFLGKNAAFEVKTARFCTNLFDIERLCWILSGSGTGVRTEIVRKVGTVTGAGIAINHYGSTTMMYRVSSSKNVKYKLIHWSQAIISGKYHRLVHHS
jgi:hypothetical protein